MIFWLIYENLSVDENNWAKESPSASLSVHVEHSQDLESESWHLWDQLKDTDTYTTQTYNFILFYSELDFAEVIIFSSNWRDPDPCMWVRPCYGSFGVVLQNW